MATKCSPGNTLKNCVDVKATKPAPRDIGGVGRRVSIALTPEARVGDYVLLHTGYALNVLNEEEAQETLSLLERMVEAGEGRE